MDANLDLSAVASALFERFGPPASPAALLALTPFELVTLFTRSKDGCEDGSFDPLAELHRHNHGVRVKKGIAPDTPDWLMPKVPRWP